MKFVNMKLIKEIQVEGAELDIIRELFREYEKELDADLCFQHFEEELKDPLQKYGGPKGALLLAYWNNQPAGCIALAPMHLQGYCEMKRLYVRTGYRQFGIGKTLVHQIIDLARTLGYQVMRLDTLKKLQSAIYLYEEYGFDYIESYYHNPLPEVVFMERKIV